MFSHVSRIAAARSLADDIYANKIAPTSDVAARYLSADLAGRLTRKR